MATDYVVRFTGLDNLSGTINQVRQRLNDVGSATTQLDLIREKFNKIELSTAPLKRKLRDVKALMAEMNLNGLSGTDLFNRMAQLAGSYADALGDATTATNVFANDNFKLEAMALGLLGIAGAANVATGIMGLLGTENEDVARAIMKVQSVLAVLNGVQAIANVLNKDSAFMLRIKQIRTLASTAATTGDTVATTANTVATGANTAATVINTTALKAWNVAKAVAKALLGDWTGLVLVGAVALGTYALATSDSTDKLEEQANNTDKAREAQNKYNEDLANNSGTLIGKYKLLLNEWKNLKSTAEKVQWIKDNSTEFRNLGVKVTDLKTAEDVFVSNTKNVVAALKARASAMAALSMLTQAYTEYYKKIMAADGSVAGGGFYHSVKAGNTFELGSDVMNDLIRVMKANGDVTATGDAYNKDGKYYTMNRGNFVLSEFGAAAINSLRNSEAATLNQSVKAGALKELDKVVDFCTGKINQAQQVIDANGLDFNLGSGSGGSGSKGGGSTKSTPTAPDYQKGSLADEEAELSRLQKVLKNTKFESDLAREAAIKAVADLAAKVKALKLALGIDVEPVVDMSDDTITGLSNQIQAIEKRLKELLLSDTDRANLVAELKVKVKAKEALEVKSGMKQPEQPKTRSEVYGELQSLGSLVQSDFDNGLINKEQALQQIADINKQIEALGGKPIELEFMSNLDMVIGEATAGIDALKGIDGVVSSVENLTNSLKDGANAWDIFMASVDVATSVMSAIQTAVEAYNIISSIFTAKKVAEGAASTTAAGAMATAEGIKAAADTASIAPALAATAAAKSLEAAYLDLAAAAYFAAHAYIPFAGFGIAAGFVSGMMGMMAALTAASAALATFADGGIVSGNSFHGDKILARVNAGEMVLNQKQQANLFNALDGGVGGGVTVSEVKIKGSDLYLALKNYNNKMSKIK